MPFTDSGVTVGAKPTSIKGTKCAELLVINALLDLLNTIGMELLPLATVSRPLSLGIREVTAVYSNVALSDIVFPFMVTTTTV